MALRASDIDALLSPAPVQSRPRGLRASDIDALIGAPTLNARASGSAGAVNKKAEAIWGGSFDDWKKRKEADDAEQARMVAESEAGNVGSRRAQDFQRKVAALNKEGDQTGDYSADSLRAGRSLEMGMEQGREQIGAGLQFAGETPLALADFFGRIRPKGETEQDRSNPVTEAGKDIRGAAVARQQEIAPLMIDRPESLLSVQGAKYIAQSALQSAPTTGTGLAAAVINPAAGLTLMGAGAGSAKFADARAEDKGYWLSAEAGAAAAAAEVVPEMLPLGFLSGRLLKHLPGTAMKRLASSPAGRGALLSLSEGASEGVTELSNIAYEIAREGKTYTDEQIANRLIDATAVGTVMGGGMAAVAEATGQNARAYDQSKIADLELENSLRAAIKPRATTARILGPTATPDAAAGAQIADDAFRSAGVGTVAAADIAEQDALARDLDAAQRDQLGSEAEIDRLLTGNTPRERTDLYRASIPGAIPQGVRVTSDQDGFAAPGAIGGRNAPAPQQFTELADGSVFVPGDPVALRQRLADANDRAVQAVHAAKDRDSYVSAVHSFGKSAASGTTVTDADTGITYDIKKSRNEKTGAEYVTFEAVDGKGQNDFTFTTKADGTVVVTGNVSFPMAGSATVTSPMGVARTINGVPGVRFSASSWADVQGVVGGPVLQGSTGGSLPGIGYSAPASVNRAAAIPTESRLPDGEVLGSDATQPVAGVPGARPAGVGRVQDVPRNDAAASTQPAREPAAEVVIPQDKRDKTYLSLLNRAKQVGDGLYELTDKQVTPAIRSALRSDRDAASNFPGSPAQPTASFTLRPKADVTGNQHDRGYILSDTRARYLERASRDALRIAQAQAPTQTEAAVDGSLASGGIAGTGSTVLGNEPAGIGGASGAGANVARNDEAAIRGSAVFPATGDAAVTESGAATGDQQSATPAPPALRDLTDDERNFWPALTSEIRASIDNPGGRMISNADGSVGRTKWADLGPMSGFWRERPAGWNSDVVLTALDRAQTGEKLSVKQRNIVEYAKGWVRQYAADNNADLLAYEQDSKAAQRESVRDDIESTLASVADTSPQQRASVVSLGHDYTRRLLELKKLRGSWGLNPDQQEEYTSLLEQDRETGKVGGRPIPGVGNKVAFVDAMEQGRIKPVIGFGDLDNFKAINDKFGHEAGDEVIRAYAEHIASEFPGSTWGRGGDEFLVDGASREEIDAKMARVRAKMAAEKFEITLADGSIATLEGVQFSYGTGATESEADANLKQDKLDRKAAGLRYDREESDARRLDAPTDRRRTPQPGQDAGRGDSSGDAAAEGVGDERQEGGRVQSGDAGNGSDLGGSGPRTEAVRGGQAGSREASGGIATVRSAISRTLGAKHLQRLDSRKTAGGLKLYNLVDDFADLPSDVKAQIDRPESAAAFVLPDGRIFIIANRVTDNPVGVHVHEVGVHFGMSGILGADFPAVLRNFKRQRAKDAAVGRAYERATEAAERGEDGELTADALATLDEEALAYYVEANWNAKDSRGIIAKVIDAIKSMLNRLGIPLSTLNASPEMLRKVAIGAARKAADGRVSVGKGGGLRYHKAWHGSPHDFDKFRLDDSTIGTGEGAQAFGHGLYFAGREELGEHYRSALSGRSVKAGGKTMSHADFIEAVVEMAPAPKSLESAVRSQANEAGIAIIERGVPYQDYVAKLRSGPYARMYAGLADAIERMAPVKNAGRLYEVELAPDESDYLDWDAPLSEQSSKVQQSVYNLLTDLGVSSTVANYYASSKSGADVYREISRLAGGDKAASTKLRSERVPGIRYLDGSSRGGKTGWRVKFKNGQYSGKVFDTKAEADAAVERGEYNMVDRVEKIDDLSHNFVIFDDSQVEVKAKYSRRADGGSVVGMGDTININGIDRPTANSAGMPIADSEDGIRAFWEWFGNSRAVDEGGRPLVVYHGTNAEFDSFDMSRGGANWDDDASRAGVFFSDDKDDADHFAGIAKSRGGGAATRFEGYLALKNPMSINDDILSEFVDDWLAELEDSDPAEYEAQVITRAWENSGGIHKGLELAIVYARRRGMDGAIIDVESPSGSRWFAAFSPDVIRSTKSFQDTRQAPPREGLGASGPRYSRTITVDGTERPTTDSTGKAIHPTEEGVRNFWRWFGDSKVVDAEGHPLVVYHGTPKGGFDSFNTRNKKGATQDFNAAMGAHFTESQGTADRFAEGLYGEGDAPQVYRVYLKIDNPLSAGKFVSASMAAADERRWNAEIKEHDRKMAAWHVNDIPMEEFAALIESDGIDAAFERQDQLRGTPPQAPELPARRNPVSESDLVEISTGLSYDAVVDMSVRQRKALGVKAQDTLKSMGYDGVSYRNSSEREGWGTETWIIFDPTQVKSADSNTGTFSPTDKRIAYSRRTAEPEGLPPPVAIESHLSNMLKLRAFWDSAVDVMARQPGLKPLADAVRSYFDNVRRRQGLVNEVLRAPVKAASKADLDAFERYQYALQNNLRADVSEELAGMTDKGRALVSAWEKVAKLTNDENQKVGVQVFDPKIGGWRKIGTARNFFPRVLKPKFQEAMRQPHKYPAEWNQLVRILLDAGRIQSAEDAQEFLNRSFSNESAFEYFAGIEKARMEPLPRDLYDYSMDAAIGYKDAWADRLSQIEAFGQRIGQGDQAKDKFDEVLLTVTDDNTRNYVTRVRERITNTNSKSPFYKFMANMNTLVTGLMLGNPATAALNIIGGLSNNAMVFPLGPNLKAFKELRHLGSGIRDAVANGVLIDDYMGVSADAAAQGVSERLSNLTQGLLNWGGYNGTEYINRVHSMLVGKHFLSDSLTAINKNPRSRKSLLATAFMQRNGFDVDALAAETMKAADERPETNRFLRFAANLTQGSYRIDQTPIFVDEPIGKFLFKYQKFGTQINRVFYQQMLRPFVQSVFKGGEPVTLKNADGTEAQERVRNFVPLIRFIVGAIPGGMLVQFVREAFFGYGEDGPDEDEIRRKLADGETAAAAAMLAERAFIAITALGAGGFLGNYMQTAKDFQERQRYKNPMDPPGLAPVKSFVNFVMKLNDQGKITMDDVEQEIQNNVSLYRTTKRLLSSGINMVSDESVTFAAREAARREHNHVRYMARRYADSVGIEAKRRAPSEIATTANTPTNRAIKDALLLGDGETARALAAEYVASFDNAYDAANALASIRNSIRLGQPALVQLAPSETERRRFMRWAFSNLTPEGYARIKETDEKYRKAAASSGLWKPESDAAAMKRDRKADESKAQWSESQRNSFLRSKGLKR